MKLAKILILLSFLIFSNYNAQISGYFLPKDSLIVKSTLALRTAASCAAPNGGMNSIPAPPGSYAVLQAGGYCNPNSYGKTGTVCWSFVPTGNSITINSGYSTSGCTNACGISFNSFILYACAPSCTVVGSGLSFSVNIGQCYTWCMNYVISGGGCPNACGFNDFCPYYQQSIILPIELLYFAGSNQGDVNVFQWKTASEKNNSYFEIEVSSDAQNWKSIDKINGSVDSHSEITYNYKDNNFSKGLNYYRLKQVDVNGSYKYHGIIYINNSVTYNVIKRLTILGTEISEGYEGIYIEVDDMGVYRKKCCNPLR